MADIKSDFDSRLTGVRESARLVELTPIDKSEHIDDSQITQTDQDALINKRKELLGEFMEKPINEALANKIPAEAVLNAIHQGTQDGKNHKNSFLYKFYSALQKLYPRI